MWYADIYKQEQEKKKADEENKMIQLFNNTFDITFDRLQEQRANIRTDDASTHYLDKETNDIYSYNYHNKSWYKNMYKKSYNNNLMYLFDKE